VTGFFNMVLVYNKGAAFSFLSDAAGWQTPALVVFALVAIGIVGTFIVRSPGRRTLFFEPEGPGFVRLTVMDGRGATDSVVVRLQ